MDNKKTNTAQDSINPIKLLHDQIKTGGVVTLFFNQVSDDLQSMSNAIVSAKERLSGLKSRLAVSSASAVPPSAQVPKDKQVASAAIVEAVSDKSDIRIDKSLPSNSPQLSVPKNPPKDAVLSKPAEVVSAKPSYIRGSFTPPPQMPKSTLGQMTATRGRDFRTSTVGAGARTRPAGERSVPSTRPSTRTPVATVPVLTQRKAPDKKKEHRTSDASKMSKRTLIRKGFITVDVDDARAGMRRLKNKKVKDGSAQFVSAKIEKATITTENLTVKILSEKIGKTSQEIIKQLMVLGTMCTINSVVDFATMELVANELGVELELKLDKTKEEELVEIHDDKEDDVDSLVKRPPVVAVMGHVDHGKTSLLDAIRKTNIVSGEAGGITQHIGAYSVVSNGETITFLDTPGHEAFTQMRARGAKVTDIAVLVVAADDGVMPQTIEAINHIKAANVPMMVAINKMDRPDANPQKVKEMLSTHGVLSEEWGGDTIMVPLAAKTGLGIDKLLENILFLAEYHGFKANSNRTARGNIIEAKLDKGKGPVATIIVQNGTLKVGDIVVSGRTYGKIRGMMDWTGAKVKLATPSTAVAVLGFNDVPSAGDGIFVVDDEKLAKQVVSEREDKYKAEQMAIGHKVSLDDMFDRISQSRLKELNIIVKADVQGSAEALQTSLVRLSSEEVKVKVVHSGVGAITKSDIMLAEVSKAIIVAFNIRPDFDSRQLAEKSNIDIRQYKIIYEALDDITRAVKGLEKPVYRDIALGRVQVRDVFKLSSHGVIAGSYVLSGKIQRNARARLWRGSELVFDGIVTSLKRFKEDVREVSSGYECGISLSGCDGYQIGDEMEIYMQEQINK